MRIHIVIDTDNAAFEDPNELKRILNTVPEKINKRASALFDINGNKVGHIELENETQRYPWE